MMIQTVLFDLDNTLLDFDRGEAEAIRSAFQEAGLPSGPEVQRRYHEINGRQWKRLELGEITREQVLLDRFEIIFQELGVQADPYAVSERYEWFLSQQGQLLPGVREVLEILAPRYALYLASNGTARVQYSRLAVSGLEMYFRHCFISEEVGYDKPRREFFTGCFAQIPDFHREETIVVGDSLTSDILGGRNAGLLTCWVNPSGGSGREEIRPDFTITELSQLPPLLERL